MTPDPDLVSVDEPMQVAAPIAELRRTPSGQRDRQFIYGAPVTVLHHAGDWRLVRAELDGYCGYVTADALGPRRAATHTVTARSTQAYETPHFKSTDQMNLTFGSKLVAKSETATFIETELGHIPRQHVHRISDTATDPIAIASLFLGTPYLWGGNSAWGLDCSALVQFACQACAIPCPGDSDQQEATLGEALPIGTPYQRGDLLFWKGHVALVMTPTTIIHANAGYMATVEEDIEDAITRIEAQGDGLVTAHKRLPKP
ncbi:Dipeptidyl-peptidase 6 [Roseobacter fucihabitans]|uniref:Dipeptidyl-peptidase 6 n=1 Tax=Roseobacter fucihabitans TaxID=1537242 RepID=A0ABZ2C014_9RHOB|nr:NlpC/P60 family protein [Roseobacter litoralis]MBC6964921.1 Dipeptidyl-peptidase 6 [Roseobacter litoralis]